MKSTNEYIGQRFGRYTILEYLSKDKYNNKYFLCKCDCGTVKRVRLSSLKYGEIVSCGCYLRENTAKRARKHGLSNSRLYREWVGMLDRCYRKNRKRWADYGGRGIKVCESWKESFESFMNWAYSNGYKETLTLDRIDTNGNYEPNNCRWISNKDQQRNRRNNRVVEYDGETLTLVELCEKLDLNYHLIESRLLYGWDIDKAIKTPKKEYNFRLKDTLSEREYTLNGETKKLSIWAKEYGVPLNLLHYRLKNQRMDLWDAINSIKQEGVV